MKIKIVESKSDAPDKQDFFIFDKGHNKLILILRATPEELLSLGEGGGK